MFRQDFSCPALLVVCLVPPFEFRVRGYHPLWPDFPFRFANNTAKEYKADPISLATTLGISVDFCSCSYLDVSVHCVRFPCLCIQQGMTHSGRVSPFGYLRIKACLPAPRSFSQATTSFIACNRQGIHHVHLFTCPYNVGLCMSYRDRHRSRVQLCLLDTNYYYPKCVLSHTLKKTLLLPDC